MTPTDLTTPTGAPPPRSSHPRAQGGLLVAGMWVTGIGAIFLIREATGWSWGEAWPLFVILAGMAGFLSQLVTRGEGPGLWGYVWPLATIGIGVVLLLTATGQLAISLGDLVSNGWPWLLVGWGAWNLVAAFWPGDDGRGSTSST
jgi:hypothetical protein